MNDRKETDMAEKEKQARIILEELNKQYAIPTYMEVFAIKGIIAGLKRVENEKKEGVSNE